MQLDVVSGVRSSWVGLASWVNIYSPLHASAKNTFTCGRRNQSCLKHFNCCRVGSAPEEHACCFSAVVLFGPISLSPHMVALKTYKQMLLITKSCLWCVGCNDYSVPTNKGQLSSLQRLVLSLLDETQLLVRPKKRETKGFSMLYGQCAPVRAWNRGCHQQWAIVSAYWERRRVWPRKLSHSSIVDSESLLWKIPGLSYWS